MILIEAPGSDFYAKYIRVEAELYVGDDEKWGHEDIEWNHKLCDRIDELRAANPALLDAGFIDVYIGPNRRMVEFRGFSGKLHLPVEGHKEGARVETVELGKRIFVGFEISSSLKI